MDLKTFKLDKIFTSIGNLFQDNIIQSLHSATALRRAALFFSRFGGASSKRSRRPRPGSVALDVTRAQLYIEGNPTQKAINLNYSSS